VSVGGNECGDLLMSRGSGMDYQGRRKDNIPWVGWGSVKLGQIYDDHVLSHPLPESGTTHTEGLFVALTLGSL